MENNVTRKKREDGVYFISAPNLKKQDINQFISFTPFEVERCAQFAIDMMNNENKPRGKHAKGNRQRDDEEYLFNWFIGSLAEVATYNKAIKSKINCSPVDLTMIEGFDNQDFTFYENFPISVKATKSFGNFMFLEDDKYNLEAKYLHSKGGKTTPLEVTAFIGVAIGLDKYKFDENLKKEDYKKFLISLNPKYHIYGFLGKNDLKKEKKKGNLFLKDTIISGKVKMEENNVVIRLDALNPFEGLVKLKEKILKEKNEEIEVR